MLIAVYPPSGLPELGGGLRAVGVSDLRDLADLAAAQAVGGVLVILGEEPAKALTFARRAQEMAGVSVLILAEPYQLNLLGEAHFDDFLLAPLAPGELSLRLQRLRPAAAETGAETIRFKDLELNLATYQAAVGGDPIDLTYMEYELLRFLATNPGRVWSRGQLLTNVWGYDYFGGGRTVDVHVRRLRSKLGEERSSWITTVRSVGYRFG